MLRYGQGDTERLTHGGGPKTGREPGAKKNLEFPDTDIPVSHALRADSTLSGPVRDERDGTEDMGRVVGILHEFGRA